MDNLVRYVSGRTEEYRDRKFRQADGRHLERFDPFSDIEAKPAAHDGGNHNGIRDCTFSPNVLDELISNYVLRISYDTHMGFIIRKEKQLTVPSRVIIAVARYVAKTLHGSFDEIAYQCATRKKSLTCRSTIRSL